jgi:hypothetical protein
MHEVKTYALDELMLNSVNKLVGRVGVLKIEVEGFEPKVSTFSQHVNACLTTSP